MTAGIFEQEQGESLDQWRERLDKIDTSKLNGGTIVCLADAKRRVEQLMAGDPRRSGTLTEQV
jgi:hypothetical protein